MSSDGGYNERLFGKKGLRAYLHNARYRWVRDMLAKHKVGCDSVLDLGCFDAKVIDWLPGKPSRYFGFDANWEGGLDLARARFHGDDSVTLAEICEPHQLVVPHRVQLGLAMETLEHVPAAAMCLYLDRLAASCEVVLVTVPNEIGPVFAAKHLAKMLKYGGAETYSVPEYVYQSLGMTSRVSRNQHKGFDYRAMEADLRSRFDVIEVSGIPGGPLPAFLSFGVGFVCRSRWTSEANASAVQSAG